MYLLSVELRCKLPGKLHDRAFSALFLNHTFELLINTIQCFFDIFEISISINKLNYKQM